MAHDDDEFRQIFELNYETYVEELRQDAPSAEDRRQRALVDAYRDSSLYVVAKVKAQVVGVVVLTLPTGPFSLERSLATPITEIRHQAIEVRRLAVKRAFRRRGIYLRLADYAGAYALAHGYRYLLISALQRNVGLYARLGFKPFDRSFEKGDCVYQPMVVSLQDFESDAVEKWAFPLAHEALKRREAADGSTTTRPRRPPPPSRPRRQPKAR